MEHELYTEADSAPLWYVDLRSCVKRELRRRWHAMLRTDTHRYELCHHRVADQSGEDLLTHLPLSRKELVELSRARCGESPLFGRLFWALRRCRNNCRFCNRCPEQTHSKEQSPANGLPVDGNDETVDTSDPSAPDDAIAPIPTDFTRRTVLLCPYCSRSYHGYAALKTHCSLQHPSSRWTRRKVGNCSIAVHFWTFFPISLGQIFFGQTQE